MTGIQTLRREAAAARRLSARFWIYYRLVPFLLALFTNAPVASKKRSFLNRLDSSLELLLTFMYTLR
jgi:hypothetical protein